MGNLKKFQIKKINKNDFEKQKIEIRLSELMDNKIKYGKNKINNKLYIIKNKKILNKVIPTPYQLYENFKKEIFSKSILKANNDKINRSLMNQISNCNHPLKFKKIVIKKKGMLSGSKYSFFPYLKNNKNNEEKKDEDSNVDKIQFRKKKFFYDTFMKNKDTKSKNNNIEINKLLKCFIIENGKKNDNYIINKKFYSLRKNIDKNNKSITNIKHSYSKILPIIYCNNSNFNSSSSL